MTQKDFKTDKNNQSKVINLFGKYPEKFQSVNDNLSSNGKNMDTNILNTAILETAVDLFSLICVRLNIF